jgi:hypothetical protein
MNVLGQELGCSFVAEVSLRACNAIFQELGIVTHPQHILVIVGFHDQVVGLENVLGSGLGDMAKVSDKAEHLAVHLYTVANVIGSVMRHLKRSDGKLVETEGNLLLHKTYATGQFLCHTVVVVDTLMGLTCGVYRDSTLLAQIAQSLDMVSVIMCHKYCHDSLKRNTYILEVSLDLFYRYAGINQDCMFVCAKIVAVAAAST